MNRRYFLSTLAAAVAGSAYDPERALWRPGAKLISIPKEIPAFPFDAAFLQDALRILQPYLSDWAEAAIKKWPMPKIGDTVQVRRPTRLARRADNLVIEGGEIKIFTFSAGMSQLGRS